MTVDRRYTEREMGMILRLATDFEARTLTGGGAPTTGRSLDEIEEIAGGAGISPAAIRAAAAALEEQAPNLLARFLDAPTTFRFERRVPGTLTERQLRDMFASFRWSSGAEGGEEVRLDEGIGWRHKTDEGPLTQIELVTQADHVRIRLLGRWEDPASWIVVAGGGATALASVASIAMLDPSLSVAMGMVAGFAGASWLGARAWWRHLSGKVRRRLGAKADTLEAETQRLAATGAAERAPSEIRGLTPISQ